MLRTRTIPLLSLSCMLLAGALAQAQPAGNRDAARQLALEGINATTQQDWSTAIDRLERAEQLFHAPVHLQYLATAYEHAGRLVESAQIWRRLSMEQLAPEAPPPFRTAVQTAQTEAPRVEARLGHVIVQLGTTVPGMNVELDHRPLGGAQIGLPLPVDPGRHLVTARAPGRPDFVQNVSVGEGLNQTVQVVLGGGSAAGGPAPVVTHANPLRTVGIIVGAAGLAAIVGGIITGLLAHDAFARLESECPDRTCPTDHTALGSYIDTMSLVATALYIGGGVLTAGGVVLFAVSPPRRETVTVALSGGGLRLTW